MLLCTHMWENVKNKGLQEALDGPSAVVSARCSVTWWLLQFHHLCRCYNLNQTKLCLLYKPYSRYSCGCGPPHHPGHRSIVVMVQTISVRCMFKVYLGLYAVWCARFMQVGLWFSFEVGTEKKTTHTHTHTHTPTQPYQRTRTGNMKVSAARECCVWRRRGSEVVLPLWRTAGWLPLRSVMTHWPLSEPNLTHHPANQRCLRKQKKDGVPFVYCGNDTAWKVTFLSVLG